MDKVRESIEDIAQAVREVGDGTADAIAEGTGSKRLKQEADTGVLGTVVIWLMVIEVIGAAILSAYYRTIGPFATGLMVLAAVILYVKVIRKGG